MQKVLLARMIAVVALTVVVCESRAIAQDHTRRVPVRKSNVTPRPQHAFGDAYRDDLGFRKANPRFQQTGSRYGVSDTQGLGREEDDVARRQSMDAFTTLEDGQPSAPGLLELQLDMGWSTTSEASDPFVWVSQLKYTPDGNDFLRNMKLAVTTPFELGNAGIDGNGDADFEWQQRWYAEDGSMPTIATILSVRVPSGYQSSGIDGTFTGILAKDWGPGTLILNGWGKSANGDNIEDRRDFQWGGRLAYLWRFAEDSALTIDYVNQTSEQHGESNINLLELGAQFTINDSLTIGPGVFVGLDGREATPNFGAGIRFTYGF